MADALLLIVWFVGFTDNDDMMFKISLLFDKGEIPFYPT